MRGLVVSAAVVDATNAQACSSPPWTRRRAARTASSSARATAAVAAATAAAAAAAAGGAQGHLELSGGSRAEREDLHVTIFHIGGERRGVSMEEAR